MQSMIDRWYMKLTELYNADLRSVPMLDDVRQFYSAAMTPEETYAQLYSNDQALTTTTETLQEETGEEVMDIVERSNAEIEAINLAESIDIPRVTESMILNRVVKKTWTKMPSGRTLVCEITMVNGFTHRGESSMVADAGFDLEMARKRSLVSAIQAAWPFEAYRLREEAYREKEGLRNLYLESGA